MADNEEGFGPEDLHEWQQDPRGAIFWNTLKEMFPEAISNMRGAVKKGEIQQAAEYQAHAETVEEILQLPSLLIQEMKQDKEGGKSEN
jgi:hypothetical protein